MKSFSSVIAAAVMLILGTISLFAKTPEDLRNELPAPFGLQAVALKKTITLTWQWRPPEELPVFSDFGYEIQRQDGKLFHTAKTTFEDFELAPGSYTYHVRVRGQAKEKGKKVTYISDWMGPAGGEILSACPHSPSVELTVEPTQKKYSSVTSMRFHLRGRATVETGCTLGVVRYHLDTGTGIAHSGPLTVDAQGHFDAFINAFNPEDEIPTGQVSFSITASAEDDNGPTTSSAYTLDVELENRFAPHPTDRPE